ncbi:hypothetical protein GGS23DRAFT_562272 [Durotheca rogersii]|uniref:uncharacterized protein n=1 Tax=Durotheca rogersii TaxID=419775 RepID=UPI00221E7E82|nr:uncharacterized protein GGS23DRAFT_562272 [Durotheca rogersii]KAI5864892.1 hypothetical protein GGS23DRAFT_562272 [Durotheca rogersii]
MSDYSEASVASIASALNSSQVPNVLWGHCLLNVYGIPSIIASIDFVLPDNLLSRGAEALKAIPRLKPCPDPETCLASSEERYTPPPAFHLHMDTSEITVDLYLQSETLWFLPTLDDALLCADASKLPPYFVLASDQDSLPPPRLGRGSGVFQSSKEAVVVPKAHVLLEAFIRLYARNWGKRIGAFSMAMIAYVEEYVDDDGFLDTSQLPEPLKAFYFELREGKKPLRQWAKELRQALGVLGEGSDEEDSY